MISTTKQALGRTVAALATAIAITACYEDAPTSPARPAAVAARAAAGDRAVDLGSCGKLGVQDSATLVFHAYARGAQIYRWTGTSWTFVGPVADLFADRGYTGLIATHFAGPTGPNWLSVSGSRVVGAVKDRCAVDASAIPWLLLTATPSGAGIFQDVRFIQRLATVGGIAPATPGSTIDELANVPYEAEYLFYK